MRLRNSVIVLVIAVLLFSLSFFLSTSNTVNTKALASTSLETKFIQLSSERTNLCAGSGFIEKYSDEDRIQGACCSAMDMHRYIEQVEGLEKYSYIDKIPPDPYDIPVPLAKEMLEYQRTIQLTPEQQSTYDEAVNLSHEGGPCCCKCWRWYAFEGLAKYLITEHDFSAEQIADVWDLEDGCGGSGHAHDEMMHQEGEA